MTKIEDIIQSLEHWAPRLYAEGYDNVGLLVGDKKSAVTGIMVSLDCTEAVVQDAIAKGCNLIVSHHPVIFKGLKKLTGANYVERTVALAIKNDVALYAIHTNLDNVMSGVNAMLAQKIGLEGLQILAPKTGALQKLIVFVPQAHVEKVKSAIFDAGAGHIGNYSECSFGVQGEGEFKPMEGAEPFTGKVGERNKEAEIRLEVMLPTHLNKTIVAAMKSAHPYEEVAYYLHALDNKHQNLGSGMVGHLREGVHLTGFLAKLKNNLELKVVKHTAYTGRPIQRVAVCGGSGSFLLNDAKAAGANAFVTSDFKYHEYFDAEDDIVIIDIGHYESERFTIDLIANFIRRKFTTFATHFTEVNTNPIHYY